MSFSAPERARAARWIASSIASITMGLSIIFSDATLFAIASNSALFAEMAAAMAVIPILPFECRPRLTWKAALSHLSVRRYASASHREHYRRGDRMRVVQGKRVSVRVDHGGRRISNKIKKLQNSLIHS